MVLKIPNETFLKYTRYFIIGYEVTHDFLKGGQRFSLVYMFQKMFAKYVCH